MPPDTPLAAEAAILAHMTIYSLFIYIDDLRILLGAR